MATLPFPEIAKFVIVGGVNTCCSLSVIFFASAILGCSPYVANLLGYIVGVCFSYLMNRTWTFRSSRSHQAAIPRFLIVFAVSYACNLLTLHMLMDIIGEFPAQLAGAAIYVGVSFVGSRLFTFTDRRA
ncbi:MAG: GtrA family protein [Alphaproteobacteria bacterium]|nr:GtrA family protein [Alphaproteobacteria bacterium]